MLVDVYAVFADTCGRGFAGNKIAPKANEAQGYVPFFLSSTVPARKALRLRAPGPRPLPGLGVAAGARRARQAAL